MEIRKNRRIFVAVIKKQNNMKTMTIRIYSNEIDAIRLAFIRNKFVVFEETEKFLTVEGTKDDILKLYDTYLLNDDKFNAAYPEFITYAERVKYTEKMCKSIKDYFRKALSEIIDNGEETEEFKRLSKIYLHEL